MIEILDFIVWLILFLVLAGIVLVLNYWVYLFQHQDNYSRDELLDFYNIIMNELRRLMGQDDPAINYASAGVGVATAIGLALLGGVFVNDLMAIPDYAEPQAANYFFQSILFVVVLHLVWPSIRDMAMDQGGFLLRLTDSEIPYFFGLSVGLAAFNLMVWGVHNEMNFFFCVGNMLACLVYGGYRVNTLEQYMAERGVYEESEYDEGYADSYDEAEPYDPDAADQDDRRQGPEY